MKRHAHIKLRGANKMVMFALLAVLLISLGYLAMQSKEGFKEGAEPVSTSGENASATPASADASASLIASMNAKNTTHTKVCSLDSAKKTYTAKECANAGGGWA